MANPPRFSIAPGSERFFSPNGDDQDDTVTVSYCLSEAAEVDARVVDAAGSTLRTLESGVSHGGSPICNSWNNAVEWDGKDDAGRVVAAGTYALRLHAVDAAGTDGEASVRLGVDLRLPGALTSPAAGDTVSDSMRWVFTPTAGFDVDSVSVRPRRGSDHSTAPAGDGTFTGNRTPPAARAGPTRSTPGCPGTTPSGRATPGWRRRWRSPSATRRGSASPREASASSAPTARPGGHRQGQLLPVDGGHGHGQRHRRGRVVGADPGAH